jgi:anti-anti-sigma factor
MKITRTVTGSGVDVTVEGRLDGYWADHLDSALSEVVRDGQHRIRLDCSEVSFLSSASIGVLVKFHRELARINGTFHVVNPSARVLAVLEMTRLAATLVEPTRAAGAVASDERPRGRRTDRGGVAFDAFALDSRVPLTCRTVGRAGPLATGAFVNEDCVRLASLAPTFAIGIGAFGDSFADCRPRFGELISVAGATAYQPADGTNVADYLVAAGPLAADVRVLYALECEGTFSQLIRFEMLEDGATDCLRTALRRPAPNRSASSSSPKPRVWSARRSAGRRPSRSRTRTSSRTRASALD